MADPTFGLTIQEQNNEPRPAITSDLSVAGFVVTAPGADATAFPLNTPVLMNSADDDTAALLGTTGSIVGQLDLLNAQLSGFSASASVVIVRVDEGADDAATMVNLIDGLGHLEESGAILGVAPRLVAVPGYTHQQETSATANPVVAALSVTLERLTAHAVVSGPHNTLQGYTDWRETISGKRLIPQETWVKVGFPAVEMDSVAGVIGMIIARDNDNGGVPSKSAANRAMQGIVGPNRSIPFSLTDGNTEGQQILALNGGIIVGGQAGSETALGDGGFVYVGTDTASEDSLWMFYNKTRMRDYIHLMFLRTLRFFLGRFNLRAQTVESILNTMTLSLRDLESDGDILGFRVGFERDKNSVANLRLGRFKLYFKAEEPPVLRRLDIESYTYAPALDDLLDDLLASATG